MTNPWECLVATAQGLAAATALVGLAAAERYLLGLLERSAEYEPGDLVTVYGNARPPYYVVSRRWWYFELHSSDGDFTLRGVHVRDLAPYAWPPPATNPTSHG